MGRVNYRESVVVGGGVGGSLIPLEGIACVPYIVNTDGTEGAQANAYVDRTSNTPAPTLATDATGSVNYWLDAGDYNIHVSDQEAPPRITAYVRGFTAPIVDTNQLVQSTQNLIQFSGDTKFSHQVADHGLKTDGSYEWLLMNSDADGGGRKISHTEYAAIWQLLGSPAPDSSGNFRLPNISGRALIAAGAASGLTARHLLDSFGEETHVLTDLESGVNRNGVTGNQSADHTHSGTTGGQSQTHIHAPAGVQTGGFLTYASVGGWGSVTLGGTTNLGNEDTGPNLQDHTHAFGTGGVSSNHDHLFTSRNADNNHNNMSPMFGMNLFVKS